MAHVVLISRPSEVNAGAFRFRSIDITLRLPFIGTHRGNFDRGNDMTKWLVVGLLFTASLFYTNATEAQQPVQDASARNAKVVSGKAYQPRHHHHHSHLRAWKNRWFHNNPLPPLKAGDGCGCYPKYYGGFHMSHFDRLGVPHGDIGFRGPSIYWTPW